ncbi:hypothetical protein [Kitasatospora sp. NPDC098663]|uniref:hypothetical protein n=1 Tax=Kitasatospora sp. NPDC098663 TaxID=3364096 RepID=UPI0037FA51B5
MVVLGMLIPVVLGLAVVTNFRGIRDFFALSESGETKKSAPVILLLISWFFMLVPGAAVLDMAITALLH